MGTVKVKIRINEAEFEAEGSRDDVDGMLGVWWEKVLSLPDSLEKSAADDPIEASSAKKSRVSKSRSRRAPKQDTTDSQKFDANALANRIKQLPNAEVLTQHVWHEKDTYNKVALVCLLAEQPLTSGDIHRVLTSLQIKIDLPRVSTTLKKNATKFLNSAPRKLGGAAPRYELTSAAAGALRQVIDAAR